MFGEPFLQRTIANCKILLWCGSLAKIPGGRDELGGTVALTSAV
jgi:hypothetical protein